VVWQACQQAAHRAGIQKELHPHTLRHYAASRTMPRGSNRSRPRPAECGGAVAHIACRMRHSPEVCVRVV
jgi:integrase